MNTFLPKVKKAIAAGVSAGVLYWAKAQVDGLDAAEIGQIAAAVVVAGIAVYFTPKNADA